MASEQPQGQPQQQALALPRPSTTTITPPYAPRLSNIVCGLNLNCRLDYQHIANSGRQFDNTGLARGRKGSRFPAAVLRIKEPRATALVFNSGKMQLLGTKSLGDAHLASRKFVRILAKMGYQPRPGKLCVQNMVAHVDTRMMVRLEGLVREHYLYARYEPEIFSGLVYGMVEPKVTFLIFAKGQVIILGAKKEEDVQNAFGRLWPVLCKYRQV